MKNKQLTISLLFLFLFSLGSLWAQPASKVTKDLITSGSENRSFTSEINGKSYKLLVNLPQNYHTSNTAKYPALYMLDGQWDFVSITSIYGSLHWDRHIPDLIIVGITYDGANPDYENLRASDLTPSKMSYFPTSGGGAKFVEVLEKEIIPIVDNTYRTNKKDRTIAGTSFAGLFPHYVLFNAPHLFNGYIINNPSLFYDDGLPFKYEEAYAKAHDTLDAKVYMVSGEFDNVPVFKKMTAQIQSRKYKKLQFDELIAGDTGHSGSKFEGYTKGMLHVYKRRGISFPEETLEEYAGEYKVGPGMDNLHIRAKEGHLICLLYTSPSPRD